MAAPLSQSILIITGAAYDQAALDAAFAHYGLRLRLVNRGDSALAALRAEPVALVLLEVGLAGSADFELCHYLNKAAGARLPMLLMSHLPNDDERQRAERAGATGYLRLPYSTEELVEKVLSELTVHHAWPARPDTPAFDARAFTVNYLDMVGASPDCVMLFDAEQGHPLAVNRSGELLLGRSSAQLSGMHLEDLCPPAQPDGRPSSQAVQDLLRRVLAGDSKVIALSLLHSDGHRIDCELRLVMLDQDGRRLYHVRMMDVTGHKQAEALRAGQNQLLEMIARGAPLQQTLDALMLLIESQSPGVLCSTLLLDLDGGTMRSCSGPTLPPEFMAAIDGTAIGPEVGSCGTAMFRRTPVIVEDIANDPLWAPYKQLAAPHGLRACWSIPIILDQDKLLGTFAMYYREVRRPGPQEMRLIDVATHLAGIAIARSRHEDDLRYHREALEEEVAVRTMELRRAKDEAELASSELAATLAHLSATQDELVRRDKLAALGALVAGVAHELNTPIGNSLMVASTMLDRTGDIQSQLGPGLKRSELDGYLAQAQEADEILLRNLRRAARLLQSFKEIAVDTDQAQRRRFALDNYISELLLQLNAAVKHRAVKVTLDITPGLEMDSYPGPLGQVIQSLFENSLLHGFDGRDGGQVHIRARDAGADGIVLCYSDDGAGIPPQHLGRIYDPFFTTRMGAGGSGLGLHVAHNIVTGVLGGRISVDSAPGQGTAFHLTLPAVAPL